MPRTRRRSARARGTARAAPALAGAPRAGGQAEAREPARVAVHAQPVGPEPERQHHLLEELVQEVVRGDALGQDQARVGQQRGSRADGLRLRALRPRDERSRRARAVRGPLAVARPTTRRRGSQAGPRAHARRPTRRGATGRMPAPRQLRAQPPKTPRRKCTQQLAGSSPRECGGCWTPSRGSAEAEPPPYAAAPSRPWDVPGARRSARATHFAPWVFNFSRASRFVSDWIPYESSFGDLPGSVTFGPERVSPRSSSRRPKTQDYRPPRRSLVRGHCFPRGK